MSEHSTMEFIMRQNKMTKTKACFTENMDRIGRIYLPFQFLKKQNIDDEIIVQLATDINTFTAGGYVARFVYDKKTPKKVRFAEDIAEKGELGVIYISKNILECMGVQDEIAVRVTPPGETGGAAIAR